jgi:putative ABC transport system permease protein
VTLALLRYNLRSLVARRGATALSVLSIGFSVGILVLVLALARGFELSLKQTGREDNLLILRQGATSEGESGVTRDKARMLRSFEGVALGPGGMPLVAAECYAALNLPREGGGTANFPLRGVSPASFAIRDFAHIAEGRRFQQGTREVVVGKSLLGRIHGCRVGGRLEIEHQEWPVVGVLDSKGGAYDSEIWCDAEVFMQVLNRPVYQSVVLRRATPAPAEGPDLLKERLEEDRRLDAKVFTEPGYFASQAGLLGDVLTFVGYFIAGIMATGAAFGTAVTLLASLAERTREIGTLLALGFRPRQVLVGFLVEALVLGAAGGVVGVLLALPVHNVATGTMNWKTFTEQAFAFRITADVVVAAIAFATLVGVAAGLLPAWRASRLPPSVALRE